MKSLLGVLGLRCGVGGAGRGAGQVHIEDILGLRCGRYGVGGVGRSLGQIHIEDIVAEEYPVSGVRQYLGYLLRVFYLPHVQVS